MDDALAIVEAEDVSSLQAPYEILKAGVTDDIKFDLWLDEQEWVPFKDENYVYEYDLINAFLHFVRPGDVCIDAGANCGYHSLLLSRLVGDSGGVIAFEPDPTHFVRLIKNLELNNVGNVRAFPNALWSSDGSAPFWSVSGGGYSSFAKFENFHPTEVMVPMFALDNVVSLDANIRMMKIDCEGAEEQILHGAERLLSKTVDYVIVEFNFGIMGAFGSTERSIRDYMASLGYDFFVLRRDGSIPVLVPPELKIEMEGTQPHIFNGLFAKRAAHDTDSFSHWGKHVWK
ncbi:MAG TPA: FkbM family methyltransferase [Anaerolineae bacterium]|nr:FkbM family methyltransferase [Anaerolineae bacterium]